jgi:hypothetical protein
MLLIEPLLRSLSLGWMPSLIEDIISFWALRPRKLHVVDATPVG